MTIRNVSGQARVMLAAATLTALAGVVAILAMILAPPDATAQQGPPGTPDNVTVTRSDGSLTASWPAVSGATGYHITYTSNGGASWSLAAFDHPSTSITIDNVENSATYVVAVRAMDASTAGNWRNSASAGPFVPTSTPTATSTPSPTPTPDPDSAPPARITVSESGLVTWGTKDWQFDPVAGIFFDYFELKWIETAGNGENLDWADAFRYRIYDPNAYSYQLPNLDSSKRYAVRLHVQLRTGAVEFGAPAPTPTPTATPTMTPTAVPTDTPEPTATSSPTPTTIPTPTMTPTAVPTDTPEPTATPSPTSTPIESTPPGALPDRPTFVTIARVSQSLFVYWGAVSGATSYRVEYSSDNGETWQLAHANDVASPAAIDGVTDSLSYIVRVRAQNSAGHSDWRVSSPANPYVSPTPDAPPGKPTWISVGRFIGGLNVTWSPIYGATGYHVVYSSDGGASWTAASDNHSPAAMYIRDIMDDLTYIVAVRSRNGAGYSDWRNSDPVGPLASTSPATPDTVTVTRVVGALEVSWPSASVPSNYHIVYSSNGGLSWSLAASDHTTASITITGVSDTSTYIVGVRAWNSAGSSGWRNSEPVGPLGP